MTAKEVLKEADKALSTITDHENAKNEFRQLWFLCVTDDEAVTKEHKLKFISANFSGDEGYSNIQGRTSLI